MEKTLNFSIFKEKIIKTNELLKVLVDKNKLLDQAQKWNQHLKTRLELSKNENNKLKLRNQTLEKNVTSIEKNYEGLKQEHDVLKEDFVKLERESGNTINSLQINYQLTNQELRECKRKIAGLEQQLVAEANPEKIYVSESPVKKKKSPGRSKKQLAHRKNDNSDAQNENATLISRVYELQLEKEKLVCENGSLDKQMVELRKEFVKKEASLVHDINKLREELCKLKEKYSDLPLLDDNLNQKVEHELQLKDVEIAELKKKYDETLKNKQHEVQNLGKKIKKMEAGLVKLKTENERLQDENSSYEVEIQLLRGSSTLDTEAISNRGDEMTAVENCVSDPVEVQQETIVDDVEKVRESNLTPTDQEVSTILKQMIAPTQLSPMRKSTSKCLNENRILPPLDENTQETTSFPVNSNRNRAASPPNDYLKDIVNRRRILRKRRLFTKNKMKHVDLLGTLLALKRANVNFVISSDSLVPSKNNFLHYSNNPNVSRVKIKPTEKKTSAFTKELNCGLSCCKNSYMMLKECSTEEDAPLLGFVEVKNEISPQGADRTEKRKNISNLTELIQCKKVTAKMRKSAKNGDRIDKDVSKVPPEKIRLKHAINVSNNSLDLDNDNTENLVTVTKSNKERDREITPDKMCSRDNLEVKSRSKSPRKNKHNSRKDSIDNTTVLKDVDEGYSSYRRENSPEYMSNSQSIQVQPQTPRRSKRKSNCKKSVIKKKVVIVNNKLAITNCSTPYLDMCSNNEENLVSSPKKLHQIQFKPSLTEDVEENLEQETSPVKKPTLNTKSPKTSFKRPVCSTRRSLRLVAMTEPSDPMDESLQETKVQETLPLESPRSPSPPPREDNPRLHTPTSETPLSSTREQESPTKQPVLIPLHKVQENVEKMPTSKIEMLFNKLIVYSSEEKALSEVVKEFSSQDPHYIAEAVLERVAVDYHDAPDTKYNPAPLMTDVQRTMLGFMSKLEKTNVVGVFDSYLTLAEQRILTAKEFQQLAPITRLYLAVCKLQKNLTRMRKLCCDVFYFCGDNAVPFLFMVLTSWTEVLPQETNSKDMPIARVLVQIIFIKDCNKPGYNLLPLRDLLHKFYGYPTERWDVNEFFVELFYGYLRNPVRSSDLALLLYCKNRPEKWVYEKIEEHIKPIVDQKIADNFKATVIILIGNLYNRFSSKSEINYLPRIREWFSSLVTETTPDVIKRSVYLCLNRLKKK